MEITERQLGYLANVAMLAESSLHNHSLEILRTHLIDVGSTILIGMALFRLGIITGARSTRFYLVLGAVFYLVGHALNGLEILAELPGMVFGLVVNDYATVTYDVARTSMALGHLSVLILMTRVSQLATVSRLLASVGRLALTNYLLQTLICISLFFGFGVGLFGEFRHSELIVIALTIAVAQIVLSSAYVAYFSLGPLEWLLRKLVTWPERQN